MRSLLFLFAALVALPVSSETVPTYQELAVAVAEAYVKAYRRSNGNFGMEKLDWNSPAVIYAVDPTMANKAFVAVIFPEVDGPGAGHAFFKLGQAPHYLWPLCFGQGGSEDETRGMFMAGASVGKLSTCGFLASDDD